MNLVFHTAKDNSKRINFECVTGREVSHQFPFHIHHSLCIGLITKGARRIIFLDNDICIPENELFVINPLQPHAIRQPDPHDYCVITVKGLHDCPVFSRHIRSNYCKHLFIKLLDAIQVADIEDLSVCWEELFDYLCRYHRIKPFTTVTNTVIDRTKAYVAANYQNPITVSDMAKNSCMSVFHYCRMFKSLMGISPHKYLMQYRLSISNQCLQENSPVFDTAIHSGFYDSSHFIRNFYHQMAVTPETYRNSVMKKSKNIQ
jgi:AraC-like DNA-binding protein